MGDGPNNASNHQVIELMDKTWQNSVAIALNLMDLQYMDLTDKKDNYCLLYSSFHVNMCITIGKQHVTPSIPGQMHIRRECDPSENVWSQKQIICVSCDSAAEALRKEEDVPSHPLSLVCPWHFCWSWTANAFLHNAAMLTEGGNSQKETWEQRSRSKMPDSARLFQTKSVISGITCPGSIDQSRRIAGRVISND